MMSGQARPGFPLPIQWITDAHHKPYRRCQMLTQERLKQLLHYNPETGVFTRAVRYSARYLAGQPVGAKDSKGYLQTVVDGKTIRLHRLAWFYMHGQWPEGEIDHQDGNKRNNIFSNLRNVSDAGNSQNMRRPYRNNKTGFLGVCLFRNGQYVASITVGGKGRHLGYFESAEAAHHAYLEAKRKFHPTSTL